MWAADDHMFHLCINFIHLLSRVMKRIHWKTGGCSKRRLEAPAEEKKISPGPHPLICYHNQRFGSVTIARYIELKVNYYLACNLGYYITKLYRYAWAAPGLLKN